MTVDINNFQQLSVVLSAREQNPSILTLDFLKGSGVIPGDWEPARPPVLSRQSTRILFKNGLDLIGKSGSISFSEPVGNKALDELLVTDVTQKYVSALPNLDYRGVGINPRRFMPFESQESAHRYVTEHLLNRGSWQTFGTEPMQAGINLVYTLERCQLRLSISEARIKSPDQEVPAVVFGGNFHYALGDETSEARLQALRNAVENCRSNYESFQNLIDQQFMSDASAVA